MTKDEAIELLRRENERLRTVLLREQEKTTSLRFEIAALQADLNKIQQHMGDATWDEMWRIIEGNYT